MHYVRRWRELGIHVTIRPAEFYESDQAKISYQIKRHFVHCEQPEDWELAFSPPYFRPNHERKTAYFTMYESSRWRYEHIHHLNRAEVVFVPCEWNRVGLQDSGCIRPIKLIPLGIDDAIFRCQPMNMEGPCVFGAAGRLAHGAQRKGINMVIDAFLKEFIEEKDVFLKVKSFSDCPVKSTTDNRVQLVEGFLNDQEMADWFASLTCFVSAARAEGWGLMQQEAMATGRPVISPIYAGLREFMREDDSYAVDFKEVAATEKWMDTGVWADPSESHMRHQMRSVYRDRQEAQRRGALASERVHDLTVARSADCVLERLEELGAI